MTARSSVWEVKCSALIEYPVNKRGVSHSIHRCGREANHHGVHVCDVEGCNFVWGFVLSSKEKENVSSMGEAGAELRKALMMVNASALDSSRSDAARVSHPVQEK